MRPAAGAQAFDEPSLRLRLWRGGEFEPRHPPGRAIGRRLRRAVFELPYLAFLEDEAG